MEIPEGDARTGERAERRPAGPTWAEILDGITRELDQSGLDSPRVEAERLVASTLDVVRSELICEKSRRVTPEQAIAIARAVGRRLEGEPLQHIEGSVEFRNLVLVSDRRALIPRPETEQLIDLVAVWVAKRGTLDRVLEIGVGSGAIALSLLGEGLARAVLAVDVSLAALDQARENAARSGLADRLELRTCSPEVWPEVRDAGRFDAVLSNPPYVASAEIEGLSLEVRGHDPREALDGGPDGLDVLRTVISGAPSVLVEGGRIFLEIGADQGDAVSRLFALDPRWIDPSICRDLADRPRFATAGLGVDGAVSN
jgi:release factor glutamine methyltransferase